MIKISNLSSVFVYLVRYEAGSAGDLLGIKVFPLFPSNQHTVNEE